MKNLIQVIQNGIPLDTLEPFKKIAGDLNLSEVEVINEIKDLKNKNIIKRFGPVLRNRLVGLRHNAMTTLKVPVEKIDELGEKISSFEFVTLCYERESIPFVWDFNLYFMIHGKERAEVESQIEEVINSIKDDVLDFKVLFSSQCFKQKGASY